MIDTLKYDPLLSTGDNLRMQAAKINEIVRAINTGTVWENKVQADRNIAEVYTSLPTSVQAAMIEEEFAAAEAEMEEILK